MVEGRRIRDTFYCIVDNISHLRDDMIREAHDQYRDLSYMLGGRSRCCRPDGSNLDGPVEKWKPNVAVVRAVIKFALNTGRLTPKARPTLLYGKVMFVEMC